MTKFRNVRVKMKGGKSRIQRAMILASGKLKFVKNLSRSRSSAPRHQTKTKRSVRISMRRRGRRGGSRGSIQKSVEKLVQGVAVVAPAVYEIASSPNLHGVNGALLDYSGFNFETGNFEWRRLLRGHGPWVVSSVGFKLAHKLNGLIRRL